MRVVTAKTLADWIVCGRIGIAYGQNPGYNKVTLREPKARISRRKGHLSKRTAFVREIVKEVAGCVFPKSGEGRDDSLLMGAYGE